MDISRGKESVSHSKTESKTEQTSIDCDSQYNVNMESHYNEYNDRFRALGPSDSPQRIADFENMWIKSNSGLENIRVAQCGIRREVNSTTSRSNGEKLQNFTNVYDSAMGSAGVPAGQHIGTDDVYNGDTDLMKSSEILKSLQSNYIRPQSFHSGIGGVDNHLASMIIRNQLPFMHQQNSFTLSPSLFYNPKNPVSYYDEEEAQLSPLHGVRLIHSTSRKAARDRMADICPAKDMEFVNLLDDSSDENMECEGNNGLVEKVVNTGGRMSRGSSDNTRNHSMKTGCCGKKITSTNDVVEKVKEVDSEIKKIDTGFALPKRKGDQNEDFAPVKKKTKIEEKGDMSGVEMALENIKSSHKSISGSKEREMSKNLVSSVHDLLLILPREDCIFLGTNYWIFTAEQLHFVLEHDINGFRDHLIEDIVKSGILEKGQIPDVCLIEQSSKGCVDTFPGHRGNASTDLPRMRKLAKDRILLWNECISRSENILDSSLVETEGRTNTKSGTVMVNDAATSELSESEYKSQFPLDGPISCLLPPLLREFFASISITTAYHFLAAKKTESSKVICALDKWRNDRDMLPFRFLVLARYVTGLSARVRCAISAIPPADPFTRNWMGSCLVVLTGTAREFLVSGCGFDNEDDFLRTKTKDLVPKVVQWRVVKRMAPLKGSGNVATISGWKTIVKEAIEVNDEFKGSSEQNNATSSADKEEATGLATPFPDQVTSVHSELSQDSNEVAEELCTQQSRYISSSTIAPSNDAKVSITSLEDPLTSTTFLRETLSKATSVAFLKSVGINNAEQLLLANKRTTSPLVLALIEWRIQKGYPKIQASSCVRTLYDWTQKVRDRLEGLGAAIGKSLFKKRGRPRKILSKSIKESEEAYHFRESEEFNDIHSDDEEIDEDDEIVEKVIVDEDEHEDFERNKVDHLGEADSLTSTDPLHSLSESARYFLFHAMGISTAKEFLSTKSADIASSFSVWRAKKGMATHKECDSIISVSTWKSIVREKAQIDGLGDLARITPHQNISKNTKKLDGSSTQKARINLQHFQALSCPTCLMGLPFYQFTLISNKQGSKLLCNSSVKDDEYLCLRDVRNQHPMLQGSYDKFPILQEISDNCKAQILKEGNFVTSNHFAFNSRDKSCGLIDVTNYNVLFSPEFWLKSRTKYIEELLRKFIECHACKPIHQLKETIEGPDSFEESNVEIQEANGDQTRFDQSQNNLNSTCRSVGKNVFPVKVHRDGGKIRHLLFLDTSLEKGQTAELIPGDNIKDDSPAEDSFMKTQNTDKYYFNKNIYDRKALQNIVSSLSISQIQTIVTNLYEEIFIVMKSKLGGILSAMDKVEGRSRLKPVDAMNKLISRRRLHWVAKILRTQMDFLTERKADIGISPSLSREDEDVLDGYLTLMIWESNLVEKAEIFLDWNEGTIFNALQQEISEEILSTLATSGLLKKPFDDRFWCEMSSSLLQDILDYISAYVLTTAEETFHSQRELVKTIIRRCIRTAKLLEEACDHCEGQIPPSSKITIRSLILQPTYLSLDNEASLSLNSSQCDGLQLNAFDQTPFIITEGSKDVHYSDFLNQGGHLSEDNENRSSESDVLDGRVKAHKRWYLINQVIAVAHRLLSAGAVDWLPSSSCGGVKPIYSFTMLHYTVLSSMKDRITDLNLEEYSLICPRPSWVEFDQTTFVTLESKGHNSNVFPNSLPIFLQFVWPVLNGKYGWRLNVGKSQADLCFLAPGAASRRKRVGPDKSRSTSAAKERAAILREISRLKVPCMPRHLHLILSNSVEFALKQDQSVKSVHHIPTTKCTIGKTLSCFESYICKKVGKVQECTKVRSVVKLFKVFLESVVRDILLPFEMEQFAAVIEEGRCEEVLSCEYLLRVLMILPDKLKISKPHGEEIKLVLSFLEDLVFYLSTNYTEIFDHAFHPSSVCPSDHDKDLDTTNSVFIRTLRGDFPFVNEKNIKNNLRNNESINMVTDEDKPLLTDYTFFIMQQVVVHFATAQDCVNGRRRGMKEGYPGIICRHCMHINDGNRYFFSNAFSLATAPSVIFGHLKKCVFCPDEVRSSFRELKSQHTEQKKKLPHGSQSHYYSRLWARLHSMGEGKLSASPGNNQRPHNGIQKVAKNVRDCELMTKSEGRGNELKMDKNVLQSHVDLLKFLGMSREWKNKPDLVEAMNSYYSHLESKWKAWNTDMMPDNLSSEH